MKERCWKLSLLLLALLLPLRGQAQFAGGREERGMISGNVQYLTSDQAVGQARVELKSLAGGWAGATVTDRSGRFSFAGLAFGSYTVTVSAADCARVEEQVRVDYSAAPVIIRVTKSTAAPSGGAGAVVSVHELAIPSKARKAFEKGERDLTGKNAQASVGEFERAIKVFPGYFEAYYKMALAEISMGRSAEAIDALQKSIDTSGGHYAPPHFAMGLILCYQKQFAPAQTVVERGLALDPGSATGEYSLAWAQFGLNQLVEAEKAARAALLRRAAFPEAFLLLAEIHNRQANWSGLIADLDAYLKLDSTSPTSATARALKERAQRSLVQAEKTAVVASTNP